MHTLNYLLYFFRAIIRGLLLQSVVRYENKRSFQISLCSTYYMHYVSRLVL